METAGRLDFILCLLVPMIAWIADKGCVYLKTQVYRFPVLSVAGHIRSNAAEDGVAHGIGGGDGVAAGRGFGREGAICRRGN